MDNTRHPPDIFPLRLEKVCFAYHGRLLIDALNANLRADQRTVVLGANGAGKSLLLKLMHGLLRPTSGQVRWGVTNGAPREQAMVLQKPVLLRRSVIANVIYALDVAGVARSIQRGRALEALQRTGVAHLSHRPARMVSVGEQQRIALARAWAIAPRVLFLDEPTSSLDPTSTRSVERIIGEIAASGTKIIMVTQNLGQARRIADEILFIDSGRVTEQTPAAQFFAAPNSVEAREYLKEELP
jgi:tungstate transport system ATP-binding protein